MSMPLASLNIVLDAAGEARGEMSPVIYGTVWSITRYTTQVVNSVLQSRLYIWLNFEGSFPVDSTYLGNGAASELPNAITLNAGDKLVWKWTGGTPGAVASGIVYGEVKRR